MNDMTEAFGRKTSYWRFTSLTTNLSICGIEQGYIQQEKFLKKIGTKEEQNKIIL